MSLTAICGFATVLTAREAMRLREAAPLVDKVILPAGDVMQAVQDERRRSLVLLSDPMDKSAARELKETQGRTDRTIAVLERNAGADGIRGALGGGAAERLDAAVGGLRGLAALRQGVASGVLARGVAFTSYNDLIDPCSAFLAAVRTVDDVDLDRRSRAVIGMGLAREALAREDALLTAALVSTRMGAGELREFGHYAGQRELLVETHLPLLADADRTAYERYWNGSVPDALRRLEETAVAAGPDAAPRRTDAKRWAEAAGTVLDDTARLDVQALERYKAQVEPRASRVLTEAAVTGLIGLFALTVSVLVPVRVGRRLARDLSALRHHAGEAAEVQLPRVQRRLAAGEEIDVDAEVPRPVFPASEIGRVERAVGTLQRAAVEAAVRQAEMRQAIGEVFVNLARRSQALLHRQLSLLDDMERRTKDAAELADLYRLDHLTTRMRRHAEGLVILSGAAPSRQWRRPVPLLDVVRAATAEVEDYERVEVGELPSVAVRGHAVAGLVHLIAELIENATVFSPPTCVVDVSGTGGDTLRITDRGLGMSDEALLQANLKLAETPEFALTDTDRLGLFVVSRLARRLGLRVTLERVPQGGLAAVVVIPAELLAEADETLVQTLRVPKRRPAPVEQHEFAPERTVRLRPSQRRPRPAPVRAPARQPVRDEPYPHGAPERPVPAPAAPAQPSLPSPSRRRRAAAAAGGRSPLPRRAPRPAGGGQVKAAQAVAGKRREERDADEVRSTMSAIQSGWQRARAANEAAERRADTGPAGHPSDTDPVTDTLELAKTDPTAHPPKGDSP
nr:nitrate- and nitrite sensing domain-containing protein [Streptomyces smaragdinus]